MILSDCASATRDILRLFVAICLACTFLAYSAKEAYADVPQILQIENLSQGSLGKIRIHVSHANPSSGHYVDQLEISGRIGGQSLTTTLTLQPQSSNPFTFEVSQEVPASYLSNAFVKVRAHCSLHGWSGWSDEIQIPEFRELMSTIVAAMAVSVLILRRTRRAALSRYSAA